MPYTGAKMNGADCTRLRAVCSIWLPRGSGSPGTWVSYDARRIDSRACLTPREQSLLRHASLGETLQETAKALGLGAETVSSHSKKAQAKLGTRNRTHTVAEAMRDLLIV